MPHLESFGLPCLFTGDIRTTGQDAFALNHYSAARLHYHESALYRPAMHALIEHFQRIAPTWLLIDYDWSATKQAAKYVPHCSDIVTIGRVKWIEGSKHTGKDNHAWYRFDIRHESGPVFHGRTHSGVIPHRTGACEQCGKAYEPQSRGSARRRAGSVPITGGLTLGLALGLSSHQTRQLNHLAPRKCFATSDTPMSRGSRRKAGSCCLHSMAYTTVIFGADASSSNRGDDARRSTCRHRLRLRPPDRAVVRQDDLVSVMLRIVTLTWPSSRVCV